MPIGVLGSGKIHDLEINLNSSGGDYGTKVKLKFFREGNEDVIMISDPERQKSMGDIVIPVSILKNAIKLREKLSKRFM